MEDIPPMGAMIMFNLEDGVLCLAVVTEVTQDHPPCVVCKVVGTEQKMHVRVSDISLALDATR